MSLADFIPVLPGRYKPHNTWQETLAAREEALRNRRMRAAEHWSEHTKQLPPLIVGDHVRIQNQTGPNPRKWDKTGKIIEVRQHDQYVVRIDGSGRVTLRNRKFLRKYVPVYPQRPRISIEDDMKTGTFRPYHAPESPTKSIPIEQVLQLSPAPSPTIHVPPENPMSPVKANLRTTMAHTPPVTLLEPPTLDETTSTPVRSKPHAIHRCEGFQFLRFRTHLRLQLKDKVKHLCFGNHNIAHQPLPPGDPHAHANDPLGKALETMICLQDKPCYKYYLVTYYPVFDGIV